MATDDSTSNSGGSSSGGSSSSNSGSGSNTGSGNTGSGNTGSGNTGSGNTGSGNTGSNSGNSGPGGGTTSGPMTPPPASPTEGLDTNLGTIKKDGPADLKLSTATRDQYLKIIKGFRTALQDQRNAMNNVQPIDYLGGLALDSANQTKNNLDLDVTGPGGIHEMVDKYLKYLDDFADVVNKAATHLIQSG